jgi:hypothetical protein
MCDFDFIEIKFLMICLNVSLTSQLEHDWQKPEIPSRGRLQVHLPRPKVSRRQRGARDQCYKTFYSRKLRIFIIS